MTSSIEDLKKVFENELKTKISERAKHPLVEYKTLLNCFKYYDINNTGEIDKTNWIKGILKTGLTTFNEDDLAPLYNEYATNYSDKIDYKDFCNYLYGRERTDPLSKSLTNKNINSNNETYTKNYLYNTIQNLDLNQINNNYNNQNKGYGNASNLSRTYKNINSSNNYYNNYNYNKSNKNTDNKETNDNESLINKIKEIIHTNNGVTFYSFMKFLKINEEPTSQKLSLEDLSVTIQELHLNITSSEIHQLFNYLDSEKTGRIPTNDLINIIKGTLNNKRKSNINEIFTYIDTEKTGEISVNNLKNLYNAKNHPDVLEGKKTEEEIYNQFYYTIDVYIRINQILNNSINKEQFIDYYSGISPSIQKDEDFQNILEKVWNVDKQKYKNRSGYNYLNSYDTSNGDNDIGINSIFLGVSRTKRPKYDYNYDYLEEFSKSSPNILNNKKKSSNSNNNNSETNLNNKNRNSNQNTARIINYRNRDLNNLGISSNDSNNKNINQTVIYSNTLPLGNSSNVNTKTNILDNQSRRYSEYKGIKIFKSKRYNPITDEYIQDDDTNNNTNNSQEIQNKIQAPKNNTYINNNYRQNNTENNYIKEEIGTISNKENNINDSNENIIENENENNINSEENNINLINIYQNKNLKENNALINFRKILISRGTKSIFRFQRMLSIYDRNHSGLISFDNFYTIFQAYYINISLSDIKSIFSLFDTTVSNNNSNNEVYKDSSMFQIKYDDLLRSLMGNMTIKRQLLVKKVFDSFNKDNEGKIMTSDIKTKYNYKKHPDVLNGKNTPNEIYSDFLDFLETFREYNDNLKGGYSFNMSFEEFFDFYNEISMSIEDDDYFEMLLTNCWDLDEGNNENLNNNVENNNKNQQVNQSKNSNGINSTLNNSNVNNYQGRKKNYNNDNNSSTTTNTTNSNNNEYSQNIRMKVGSQIMNNRIF